MIKQFLTAYSLALPGYLLSLYLISPVQGLSWWAWLIYLTLSYLVGYPWLLRVKPTLGIVRGMESYEPPFVKQMTDPDKQAPRVPQTAQVTLGAVIHEVGGFGLLRVLLQRWGLFLIALPWLLVVAVKKRRQ